ncbi:anti-sigma factor antagonist [Microtetraspora sp. NBRC 13810]|uniref:STAS domain-containing protein n=1 Tax=Microtetraspora sp. NBRC 13810 TaxID=3030990 RepID=UPI0024A1121C|nr:STAS domain-containing protein [Microtetraspora sp. NBRC 13810]GLW11812.1 anti-sigma factor antagonist [Microtetraspora sp. NBRC 13810]
MTALSVHTTHHPAHSVLALDGELDTATAPLLEPAVKTVLSSGRRHLVVDTADLDFCDSSGLWALLQAQRAVKAAGGTMEITHVHGPLRRVLDVTKLSRAFTINMAQENYTH